MSPFDCPLSTPGVGWFIQSFRRRSVKIAVIILADFALIAWDYPPSRIPRDPSHLIPLGIILGIIVVAHVALALLVDSVRQAAKDAAQPASERRR